MTNFEIDKALALAIGWKPEQMKGHLGALWVWDYFDGNPQTGVFFLWRRFSHLDPAVIWRVAERYDCFPYTEDYTVWLARMPDVRPCAAHPIAATAVALAVIQGVKHGQR